MKSPITTMGFGMFFGVQLANHFNIPNYIITLGAVIMITGIIVSVIQSKNSAE